MRSRARFGWKRQQPVKGSTGCWQQRRRCNLTRSSKLGHTTPPWCSHRPLPQPRHRRQACPHRCRLLLLRHRRLLPRVFRHRRRRRRRRRLPRRRHCRTRLLLRHRLLLLRHRRLLPHVFLMFGGRRTRYFPWTRSSPNMCRSARDIASNSSRLFCIVFFGPLFYIVIRAVY